MKKKIKDLTHEEREKICEKHPNCDDCPFDINYEYCFKDKLFAEVEVDE